MSKKLVVIDRCWDCPHCHAVADYPGTCSAKEWRHTSRPKTSIPDWCPLNSLPEYDMRDIVDDDTWDTAYEIGKQEGWNECLNAILGGADDE